MLDDIALPIICATKPCPYAKWFVNLNEIFNHPFLQEDEKLMWLWLATQSANNNSFCCSFTYEQISQKVNKTPKKVHQILFRLKIMGLLHVNVPVWYGEPTLEMIHATRLFKILRPPLRQYNKEMSHTPVLPMTNYNSMNVTWPQGKLNVKISKYNRKTWPYFAFLSVRIGRIVLKNFMDILSDPCYLRKKAWRACAQGKYERRGVYTK